MARVTIRTDTLEDLLREGNGLYPWCDRCGRSGPDLDLAALAAARSADFRWERLLPRCTLCGARGRPWVRLHIKWGGAPELDNTSARYGRGPV